MGGINISFQIFEACVLSFVLHNAETWDFIPKKTMKLLDDLFNYFFRKIFRISSGAPIPNFYWQTGFLTAGNVILQKKLLFCHHLSNLPEDSLGREVYDLQTRNHSLPSLFLEMKEHLASLGIDDLKTVPKTIWKKMVKGYIKNLNKN